MERGVYILTLSSSVCYVLETLLTEVLKRTGGNLMINEVINRSDYIDIIRNKDGKLAYRVVKKHGLETVLFTDSTTTTNMKVFATILKKHKFCLLTSDEAKKFSNLIIQSKND